LYSVGPDWLEYSFVDEEFVVYREFWLIYYLWPRIVYFRFINDNSKLKLC
jgi:hypothetical protein